MPPFGRAASEQQAARAKAPAKPAEEPLESAEVVPRGVWAEALAKTNAAVAAAQGAVAPAGGGHANGSSASSASSARDSRAPASQAPRLRAGAAERQRRLLSYNGGTGVWPCQCGVCAGSHTSRVAVRYWWAQDTGEVVLSLRVHPGCRSRDVSVTVSKRHVRVVVEHGAAEHGRTHGRTVVDATLAYSVVDQDIGSPPPHGAGAARNAAAAQRNASAAQPSRRRGRGESLQSQTPLLFLSPCFLFPFMVGTFLCAE